MSNDEDTQPSQRVDPRAEPPDQPKTIELDAVQVLSQLIRGVAEDVKASREEAASNFTKVDDRLTSQDRKLDKVVTEGIEANVRMTRFENRLEILEKAPSVPPINSTGIKALIDGHPSQMDLKTQAQVAELIVQHAKEKADLESKVVTKADVAAVVADATALQTTALVTKLSENKKLGVIAGLIATLLLGYLGRLATAPTPPPAPAPVVQVAPVLNADAGVK